jgi:hypothetical protein
MTDLAYMGVKQKIHTCMGKTNWEEFIEFELEELTKM